MPSLDLTFNVISKFFSERREKTIYEATFLIAAKKYFRRNKNLDFNCVVMFKEEFLKAISMLPTLLDKRLTKKARLQIILRDEEVKHYFLIDIQYSENNLSFFIIDASQQSIHYRMALAIKSALEKSRVYSCSPNFQKDGESCFIHAFSYAEIFSKIDNWHESLIENKDIKQNSGGIFIVERTHLPPQALKLSQSRRSITGYLSHKSEHRNISVNKYGYNLLDCISKYNENINDSENKIDGYIKHKHEKYSRMLELFFKKITIKELVETTRLVFRSEEFVNFLSEKNIDKSEKVDKDFHYQLLLFCFCLPVSLIYFSVTLVLGDFPNLLTDISNNEPLLCDISDKIKYFKNTDLDAIEIFLKRGINVNKKNKEGVSAILILLNSSLDDKQRSALLGLLDKYGSDSSIESIQNKMSMTKK